MSCLWLCPTYAPCAYASSHACATVYDHVCALTCATASAVLVYLKYALHVHLPI